MISVIISEMDNIITDNTNIGIWTTSGFERKTTMKFGFYVPNYSSIAELIWCGPGAISMLSRWQTWGSMYWDISLFVVVRSFRVQYVWPMGNLWCLAVVCLNIDLGCMTKRGRNSDYLEIMLVMENRHIHHHHHHHLHQWMIIDHRASSRGSRLWPRSIGISYYLSI